ncbi:ATP-binding protein [Alloacidobacterium dinghuense]|uniref:ATP-binding protein n=1 Tax=Alloacidobacterium dinghuense TaxID=2763107 RepID=A0A7G8BE54_9BACT|nr:ATP-binding protein [Alloacidobacterium dinghuense]QNI30824.1 ATP-binding protein [Alloacidobacterium dinghuense]
MDLSKEFDFSKEFIVTPTVAALRDFLSRPGARHAFLIGAPGTGKTAVLQFLANSFRAENCLVVMVRLRDIDTSNQLFVQIARAFLDQTQAQDKPLESDPLDQIRVQFANQFTVLQDLSRAAELLERIIQLVIERTGIKSRAYIFLDGLDEVYEAGDIVVAVESLAERLSSASMVVTSDPSSKVNRLGKRTAFDAFTLTPLTQAEAVQFIRRLLPDPFLTGPALEQLVLRANGNPLLLNLFASYFLKYGDLATFEKTDTIRAVLDRLYYELLGSDQTGVDARLLLSLLVFLQPVSTDYLTEISGLPVERAQAALGKLWGSMLISSSNRQVMFAHASLAEYHLENNLITNDIDINEFKFGDEAAERDALLKKNFMPPRDLNSVTSGAKTIVLGDRGAGKSAMFRALQGLNGAASAPAAAKPGTITSASQNPASFVQQMTPDDSVTSSADGFKAVWLLYSAALAARDVDVPTTSDDQHTKAFVKDSRTILRRVGWAASIKGESRASRWTAALRSIMPEKVSLKLGPITVEPNLSRRGRGWLGSDIKIDEFIDRTDRLLQATDRRLLIVFDQIDEAFKYQRDRQEALVQGLFLAESFLSLRQAIRLVVLLRTDLFELYDIQEKNKFVSRTVRLDWTREELRKQLLQRLFSNVGLRAIMESLNVAAIESSILAQIQFRIVFPTEVEGKPFEEWLFESLKNGKNHIAPRQIILFLNLAKENAKDASRRRIPLFTEKEVAQAMTRLSELSYQEVISDFRAATAFVRNCRAGKIMEFKLEDVQTLFDEDEGSVVLQLERLERLGFLARTIVKEGDLLVPRFRVPRLFTRCWETSD